jgi:hypothetical protein
VTFSKTVSAACATEYARISAKSLFGAERAHSNRLSNVSMLDDLSRRKAKMSDAMLIGVLTFLGLSLPQRRKRPIPTVCTVSGVEADKKTLDGYGRGIDSIIGSTKQGEPSRE